jgi:hypothetical protein
MIVKTSMPGECEKLARNRAAEAIGRRPPYVNALKILVIHSQRIPEKQRVI